MPGPRKSHRRKDTWHRKGSYPTYGPYPPDRPNFWAQAAILWALAEEDWERFASHLKDFLPSPLSGLNDLIDLENALKDAARLGIDLVEYVAQHRPEGSPLGRFGPLLNLIQAWKLRPSFLLPLARAAEGASTPDEVKDELYFLAFRWPRSTVPFHEVAPGRKAKEVDGQDLEAPLPRQTLERGEVSGWHPVQGQALVKFPYRRNPQKLARMVAWHKLGFSYLDIAKKVTGRHDLLDGDSVVRRIGREIQGFLKLAEQDDLPKPPAPLDNGFLSPTALSPDEVKLLNWARKRGVFDLRDILRSGPKRLRNHLMATATLQSLVREGLVQNLGEDHYKAL